jgi:prepilin-type N-terminal cleavage/methylation domain-containing protein
MSLPSLPSARAGRPAGFTLVEALIALTVLGVALLMGMALVIQLPRDVCRLDAEREAMRALEATLDGMRAGITPVQNSELCCFITSPAPPVASDLGITVVVTPTDRPGLYQVLLTAHYSLLNCQHKKLFHYSVLNSPHKKRIDALFRR